MFKFLRSNKTYDFYLAGGMRGYPDLNKPMFTKVARLLRQKGFTIWNPSEHGSYLELSYAECMKRDLNAVINECRGIALLPGWRDSIGANAEAFVAYVCNKYIVEVRFIYHTLPTGSTKIALVDIDLSDYRLPYNKDATQSFNPHE